MIKLENFEVVGWDAAIRGTRNPMNSWDKSDTDWFYVSDENKEDAANYIEQDSSEPHLYKLIGHNDLDLMMRLRNAGTDHRKFMRMITVYVDITAPLYWWKEFDTYKVGTVANSCSTMHKIADKEFTLDDFSTEHLLGSDDMIKYDIRTETSILEDPAVAVANIDGDWCCLTSKGFMSVLCDMLNYYRKKYLDTKDDPREKVSYRPGAMNRYWWQMIQLLPSSYNQKRTVMLNYEVLANMYCSRKNHKLDEWLEFCNWIKTLPYSEIITGGNTE